MWNTETGSMEFGLTSQNSTGGNKGDNRSNKKTKGIKNKNNNIKYKGRGTTSWDDINIDM